MSTISRQTALKVIYWNGVAALVIACLAVTAVTRRQHAYDALIVQVGREYNVDPRLISAVIWKESKFRVDAVGEKQECGLMQVTEAAGREWADAASHKLFTTRDLFNPETNVRAGAWYLARAIQSWSDHSDPLPIALAEYNAGRSNAIRWEAAASGDSAEAFIEAVTYETTRAYIRDILERYRGRV